MPHLRRSLIATKVCLLLLILLTLLPAQAQKNKPSGAATYALTKELLAVAPKRFNGSPGHLAAENFIKSHFAPEEKDHRLEVDSFSASTPAGQQSMRNIIVKFPAVATSPKKDGILVLGSHYETNYNLKDIAFVGANDGASTSALTSRSVNTSAPIPPRDTASGSSSSTAKRPSKSGPIATPSTDPATSPPDSPRTEPSATSKPSSTPT